MKNKAVFLDRDGVINDDKEYVHKIEDLEIISGVIEGLKLLKNAGYKRIIITNQSKIGRGICSEQDYFNFRNALVRQLNRQGAYISAEYFCPHKPDDDCNCRKPKTGMLEQAAKDFGLDLKECWMAGDTPTDIQAGINAGCRTIHVLTGQHTEPISYADFVAKDLLEAASYIITQDGNK